MEGIYGKINIGHIIRDAVQSNPKKFSELSPFFVENAMQEMQPSCPCRRILEMVHKERGRGAFFGS